MITWTEINREPVGEMHVARLGDITVAIISRNTIFARYEGKSLVLSEGPSKANIAWKADFKLPISMDKPYLEGPTVEAVKEMVEQGVSLWLETAGLVPVEDLKSSFNRIKDMIRADDGQAWKEASKFLDRMQQKYPSLFD